MNGDTGRETDRQIDTPVSATAEQRAILTYDHRAINTTDRQTERQRDRQTDRQTDTPVSATAEQRAIFTYDHRAINATDRQTDRQTERQTDRETDRQTDLLLPQQSREPS